MRTAGLWSAHYPLIVGPGLLATILINAATAFLVCGKVASFEEGIDLSQSLLKGGRVRKWLEEVRNFFAKR